MGSKPVPRINTQQQLNRVLPRDNISRHNISHPAPEPPIMRTHHSPSSDRAPYAHWQPSTSATLHHSLALLISCFTTFTIPCACSYQTTATSPSHRIGLSAAKSPSSHLSKTSSDGWIRYDTQNGGKTVTLNAYVDIDSKSRLYAGNCGKRWLWNSETGQLTLAPFFADEHLVTVNRSTNGSFLFVSNTGTLFTSHTALGPFHSVKPMTPPAQFVASSGAVVVALAGHTDPANASWMPKDRWSRDGGEHFVPLSLPPHGPLARIAVTESRQALLLDFPEKLWFSRDLDQPHGAFSQATTPAIGANLVTMDATGQLVAVGPMQFITWNTRPNTQPRISTDRFVPNLIDLMTPVEPGPNAAALHERRATFQGLTYYELVYENKTLSYLRKLTLNPVSELSEPSPELPKHAVPHKIPLSNMAHCGKAKISAANSAIVIGCIGSVSARTRMIGSLYLYMSHDAGKHWLPIPAKLSADDIQFDVTILDDHTVMLVGACTPAPDGSCNPSGIMRLVPKSTETYALLRQSKPSHFAVTDSADPAYDAPHNVTLPPGRVGRLSQVVASGARLYSIGIDSKLRRHVLLVSHDNGKSFSVTPIVLPNPALATLLLNDVGVLTVGEQRLSWVVRAKNTTVWATFDANGEVVSAHALPNDCTSLAAAGTRGLALCNHDIVRQSDDAGATYRQIAVASSRVCPTSDLDVDDDTPSIPQTKLFCSENTCVIRDELARIGWQATNGDVIKRSSPTPVPLPPRVIACRVQNATPNLIKHTVSAPDPYTTLRNDTHWIAMSEDATSHEVTATIATGSVTKPLTISQHRLLPSVRSPASDIQSITVSNSVPSSQGSEASGRFKASSNEPDFRTHHSQVAGGAASLRFRTTSKNDTVHVEVGWIDAFESTTVKHAEFSQRVPFEQKPTTSGTHHIVLLNDDTPTVQSIDSTNLVVLWTKYRGMTDKRLGNPVTLVQSTNKVTWHGLSARWPERGLQDKPIAINRFFVAHQDGTIQVGKSGTATTNFQTYDKVIPGKGMMKVALYSHDERDIDRIAWRAFPSANNDWTFAAQAFVPRDIQYEDRQIQLPHARVDSPSFSWAYKADGTKAMQLEAADSATAWMTSWAIELDPAYQGQNKSEPIGPVHPLPTSRELADRWSECAPKQKLTGYRTVSPFDPHRAPRVRITGTQVPIELTAATTVMHGEPGKSCTSGISAWKKSGDNTTHAILPLDGSASGWLLEHDIKGRELKWWKMQCESTQSGL